MISSSESAHSANTRNEFCGMHGLRCCLLSASFLLLAGCQTVGHGPPLRTVAFDAVQRLTTPDTRRTDVERTLGTPQLILSKDDGTSASYSFKFSSDTPSYPGRARLAISAQQFGGAQFFYSASGNVCSSWISGGGRLDLAPARMFKVGVTTKEQTLAEYGPPNGIFRERNGLTYLCFSTPV